MESGEMADWLKKMCSSRPEFDGSSGCTRHLEFEKNFAVFQEERNASTGAMSGFQKRTSVSKT